MQLPRPTRRLRRERGGLLPEVSVALAAATFLALFVLRSSMVVLHSNQWVILQTMTDAWLTGETALASRAPFVSLQEDGYWPAGAGAERTVTLGRLAADRPVTATLRRFSVEEPVSIGIAGADTRLIRLHSVLTYRVGDQDYVKSRTTVRTE